MVPIRAAGAVLLLITLTGCSSSKGDGRDCYPVDPALMAAIAEGANDVPITPVDAAAVKSETFDNAYIVAMSFNAPGGGEEVGVWAVATLEPPYAPILAVDGFAHEFTDYPNEINGNKLNVTEDGVTEAKACLEG
jgi:hypothetical protein